MTTTLVVHTGGIGDFLLACPALARLETSLTLLGNAERLAIAVESHIADAACDLDDVDFHTVLGTPSSRLVEFARNFDRAIVFMRDDDIRIAEAFLTIGIDTVEVYPGLPDAAWPQHASLYYAECLGVRVDPAFRLDFVPGEDAPDVVVHPGSGAEAKNWPREHFETLAERLSELGREVKWCLGPAEQDRGIGEGLAPVLPEQSLVSLARTLAGANLYIGNDSGITHLAALCGCPTVAVFGPTDPAVWSPIGPMVSVVTGEPWPAIDTVLARAQDYFT